MATAACGTEGRAGPWSTPAPPAPAPASPISRSSAEERIRFRDRSSHQRGTSAQERIHEGYAISIRRLERFLEPSLAIRYAEDHRWIADVVNDHGALGRQNAACSNLDPLDTQLAHQASDHVVGLEQPDD